MQCREFSEISEAYLSDELLVETNIQVFHHLESCPKCRQQFAEKRQLRKRIKTTFSKKDDFQIDPVFAGILKENLRATIRKQSKRRSPFLSPSFLVPAMAVVLIVFTFGFLFLNSPDKNGDRVFFPPGITKGLTQISLIAAGNHKDCALEKLEQWESMSKSDFQQKAFFTEKVLDPLKAKFSENIEMLHSHNCIYEGKEFTHVILRKNGHIVSVFIDITDNLPVNDATSAQITSEHENGLQVASFLKDNRAIFVISDLSETENLTAARTLFDSLKGQNEI